MSAWTAYLLVMGIVFGGILGSYLTMALYRVPRRIDIVRGGSRCPGCGVPLQAWQNIPFLGYLIQLGRCRRCGLRIPLRYPLIELATAAIFTALAFLNPWVAIAFFAVAVLLPAIIQWLFLPALYQAAAVGGFDVSDSDSSDT